MITYDGILQAKSILNRPADGSKANEQARQKAQHYLLIASQALTDFANIRPESPVANVLLKMAQEYTIDAMKG